MKRTASVPDVALLAVTLKSTLGLAASSVNEAGVKVTAETAPLSKTGVTTTVPPPSGRTGSETRTMRAKPPPTKMIGSLVSVSLTLTTLVGLTVTTALGVAR